MLYLSRIYGSGTHRILMKSFTIVGTSTFTFIRDTKVAPEQRNKNGHGYLVFLFLVSKWIFDRWKSILWRIL